MIDDLQFCTKPSWLSVKSEKISTEIYKITKHDKSEINGPVLDASHRNITL